MSTVTVAWADDHLKRYRKKIEELNRRFPKVLPRIINQVGNRARQSVAGISRRSEHDQTPPSSRYGHHCSNLGAAEAVLSCSIPVDKYSLSTHFRPVVSH